MVLSSILGQQVRLPCLLILLVLFHAHIVLGTFWTVTSYLEFTVASSQFGTGTDAISYTVTEIVTLNPDVTPTATPASTSTYVDTFENVTIVYVFLSPGAVNESDIETTTTFQTNVFTEYVEEMVFTAPASCPTPFTFTTYVNVYPPLEVAGQLSATATSMELYSGVTYTDTYITEYLAPNQMPPSVTAAEASLVSSYLTECFNPEASATGLYSGGGSGSTGGGGDSSGGNNYDFLCYPYGSLCTALATWVIVLAVVLPTLFLLGWLESWFWFRRLMLGKSTLRLGTVSWTCISLWAGCLIRKTPARRPEDQAVLRERWNAMGAGTRIKLWFKWGFRHRYPVELLGEDPRKSGANPGMPGVSVPTAAPPPEDPQMMFSGSQLYQEHVFAQASGDATGSSQMQLAPGPMPVHGHYMYMTAPSGVAPEQQPYMMMQQYPGQPPHDFPQEYPVQHQFTPQQGYPQP